MHPRPLQKDPSVQTMEAKQELAPKMADTVVRFPLRLKSPGKGTQRTELLMSINAFNKARYVTMKSALATNSNRIPC